MIPRRSPRLLVPCWWITLLLQAADPIPINQDESKVPAYTLPDPLRSTAGEPIRTAADWSGMRRPEVLELFRNHVYGRTPESLPRSGSTLVSDHPQARGGRATRQRIRCR